MSKKIKKCVKCGHVKNWSGDLITCPFQDSNKFGDNWNCGLIDKIRDLCDLAMQGKDNRLHYQYCDDQKYVTIKTDDIEDMGLCLWVSWYKSRGQTDAMWLLYDYAKPKEPTFEELNTIVKYYSELLMDCD